MSGVANDLSDDVLILIIQNLRNDFNILLHCALVNHVFNRAASKFLYRRVVLSPYFRVFLSLREAPIIPVRGYYLVSFPLLTLCQVNSNLVSATLPQYAQFVEILEIIGTFLCFQTTIAHKIHILSFVVVQTSLLPRRWYRLFATSTISHKYTITNDPKRNQSIFKPPCGNSNPRDFSRKNFH